MASFGADGSPVRGVKVPQSCVGFRRFPHRGGPPCPFVVPSLSCWPPYSVPAGRGAGPGAAPEPAEHGGLPASHSLRAPVTDENFYFVMADRSRTATPATTPAGSPVIG